MARQRFNGVAVPPGHVGLDVGGFVGGREGRRDGDIEGVIVGWKEEMICIVLSE